MADDAPAEPECPKCEICEPGLPKWMATFSDLVTLLLTFFVLLLSFAKTESAKYEAALGSIRNAFGGNVIKHGPVIQRGKSPDDSPTMMDSERVIKPFPIDFLTMEGLLDKHEINRASDENVKDMKNDLKEFGLKESVELYEVKEGIKVKFKDKIFFKTGSVQQRKISIEIYSKLVKMLTAKDWTVIVEGHAARGEESPDGKVDAFALSAKRASSVARDLMKQGIRSDKVVSTFYGDSRPIEKPNRPAAENRRSSQRVEFVIRKKNMKIDGHKIDNH